MRVNTNTRIVKDLGNFVISTENGEGTALGRCLHSMSTER
jgi:hypothetical protein